MYMNKKNRYDSIVQQKPKSHSSARTWCFSLCVSQYTHSNFIKKEYGWNYEIQMFTSYKATCFNHKVVIPGH